MGLLACVVFTLLVQFCEGKPLQFKGYPEGIALKNYQLFFYFLSRKFAFC